MKPILQMSRMHVTGYLLALLFFLSCKKDEIPADPSESPVAALSKTGVANLALPITGEFQTRTATRFNDYPDRRVFDNFTAQNAENVAVDDNSYIHSGKVSTRRFAMVVLQGFGFTIPPEATIDNIFVRVIRFKQGNASLRDHYATLNWRPTQFYENLNFYGPGWQNHELYTDSESEVIYSQPGTGFIGEPIYPYTWTPAMINDTDFGFTANTVAETKGMSVVYYDLVEITVEFTIP